MDERLSSVRLCLHCLLKPKEASIPGGGGGVPNFFLHISSSLVEISLHATFEPPRLPRSGIFLVREKQKAKKNNSIELLASLASSSS